MSRLIVVLVLLLAACGDPTIPEENPVGYTSYFTVQTEDGPIRCISWKEGHGGGLSCDWSER